MGVVLEPSSAAPASKGGLRHSRFNHVVQDPASNTWVLHNFASGALLRLSRVSYGLYLAAPSLDPGLPFVAGLAKRGFLVRGDEMAALRHGLRAKCYGADALVLTVCPTMACNFSCPYCFETHRPGSMSPQAQDALVAFVDRQLANFPLRHMGVMWFGGEPLLRPDIIEALTGRFREVAGARGVEYSAAIVTNGSLLTDENYALLERCGVHELQVTLDGPTPQTNDPYRRAKDGRGSFDVIVSNLRRAPKGFDIKLRCNVGRHNLHLFDDMRALQRSIDADAGAHVRLVPAVMDTDVAASDEAAEMGVGYEAVGRALSQGGYFEQDNLGGLVPESFKGPACSSSCIHTYVIDERGNLYRCWEDCGREEEAFGNVASFDNPLFDADCQKMARYLEHAWPGDDPRCAACELMPVCMGGCPHRFMATGERHCPWFKDDLDAYVLKIAAKRAAR